MEIENIAKKMNILSFPMGFDFINNFFFCGNRFIAEVDDNNSKKAPLLDHIITL